MRFHVHLLTESQNFRHIQLCHDSLALASFLLSINYDIAICVENFGSLSLCAAVVETPFLFQMALNMFFFYSEQYEMTQEPSFCEKKTGLGPQGALRGPSGGPQGVKIPLWFKVCQDAYQIISTFNGEYGKHVFEASGALRDPQGALRRPSGGPQGVKIPLRSKVCKNAYQIISTFNGE